MSLGDFRLKPSQGIFSIYLPEIRRRRFILGEEAISVVKLSIFLDTFMRLAFYHNKEVIFIRLLPNNIYYLYI